MFYLRIFSRAGKSDQKGIFVVRVRRFREDCHASAPCPCGLLPLAWRLAR